MKKLTIIGAGPGGLVLALKLYKQFDITIIEKENSIGGCWRIDWSNGLFQEHSPKVITGNNFQLLLKSLDLNPQTELVSTYSNYFSSFSKLFWNNLSFYDLFILSISFIFSKLGLFPDYTVSNWFKTFGISKKGQSFLTQFSVLLADIPEKLLITDIFYTFSFGDNLYQLTDPERWLNTIYDKLKNNVKFVFNSPVTSFNETTVITNVIIPHDCLFCTLPPNALHTILSNSPKHIQYNWGNVSNLLINSFYNSIGFQLHYTTNFPQKYFKSPLELNANDVICLVTSNYTQNFSKNPNIKEVISCTIINQKNINDYQSAIDKAVDLIHTIVGISPHLITINPLQKTTNPYFKYISNDTAFVRQKEFGLIPYKGKLNNLFLINSFNEKGLSSLDKTIDNCYRFLRHF